MAGSMESDELRNKLAALHNSAFGWAMVCCDRDRDLAADVLQQAYCRILGGDASFAGHSEFSTWVFGVIRNIAREEFRRRSRGPLSQSIALTDAVTDADEISIEQRELAEQLGAAMQQLSDRQREVLHLTFYENLTIEQAAEILETTVGTARQHYARGKAALHRILSANRELER